MDDIKGQKVTGKNGKLTNDAKTVEDQKHAQSDGWIYSPISPFKQNNDIKKLNDAKILVFSNDDRDSDLDTKMPPNEIHNKPVLVE